MAQDMVSFMFAIYTTSRLRTMSLRGLTVISCTPLQMLVTPVIANIHILVEIASGFYNTVFGKSIKIRLNRLAPCFVCVGHGGQHLSYINNNERRRKHRTRGLYVTTLYSLRTIKQIVTVKRKESCLTARAFKRKKLSAGKRLHQAYYPRPGPQSSLS